MRNKINKLIFSVSVVLSIFNTILAYNKGDANEALAWASCACFAFTTLDLLLKK